VENRRFGSSLAAANRVRTLPSRRWLRIGTSHCVVLCARRPKAGCTPCPVGAHNPQAILWADCPNFWHSHGWLSHWEVFTPVPHWGVLHHPGKPPSNQPSHSIDGSRSRSLDSVSMLCLCVGLEPQDTRASPCCKKLTPALSFSLNAHRFDST